MAGLLNWKGVDIGLVGRVGESEYCPERAALVWPPEIPNVGVSLETSKTSLCTTEGVTVGGETKADVLLKAGETPEIPDFDDSLVPTENSLCPVEGVNVEVETEEGGLASGTKTDTWGLAGLTDAEEVCTETSGTKTEAGVSDVSGASMLVLGPGKELIVEGVAD